LAGVGENPNEIVDQYIFRRPKLEGMIPKLTRRGGIRDRWLAEQKLEAENEESAQQRTGSILEVMRGLKPRGPVGAGLRE
jgi:hypothetical protein